MKATVQDEKQLVVRVPGIVKSDFGEGAVVDLKFIERKAILLRVRKRKLRLQQLLADVTKKNRHPEIATGPRVGKES